MAAGKKPDKRYEVLRHTAAPAATQPSLASHAFGTRLDALATATIAIATAA